MNLLLIFLMNWAVFVPLGIALSTATGLVGYQLGKAHGSAKANIVAPGAAPNPAALNASITLPTAKQTASTSAKPGVGRSNAASLDDFLTAFNMARAKAVVDQLGVGEIHASLAHLASLSNSDERNMLRAMLYGRWATLDPKEAWKAAIADPLEDKYGALRSAVAREWLKINPEVAFEAMLSLPAGNERRLVTEAAMSAWGRTNLTDAIAFQNAHPDLPICENYVYEGVTELCKSNPSQAAKVALGINNLRARNYALYMAMDRWAEAEPTAAIAWAQSISNTAIQNEALNQAVVTWSAKHSKEALAFAGTLPSPQQREHTINSIYGVWMEHDFSTALGYIASSTNDAEFDAIPKWSLKKMFGSMSEAEQASLVASLPDSAIKQKIVAALAEEQLRNGRYGSVVKLLNDLPDSAGRDSTVTEFGNTWAANDRKAAEAWLATQPDSSDRDLVAAGVAARLAEDDPSAAIRWASSIPDTAIRIPALKNIYMGWRASDATAADAWLTTVPEFTPADRHNLVNARKGAKFPIKVSNRP